VTPIDFHFDPTCPWCWVTSRWIEEVRPRRDLDVRWRSFSLHIKNEDLDQPERWKRSSLFGLRLLRVAEAVRDEDGEAAVGAFYTELGRRIHHDRDRDFDPADAVRAVGLPAERAEAADDGSWDEVIRATMKEALALAGDDVGVPLIVFAGDRPAAFFGPVLSPAPTGEEAVAVFDHVAALARVPGFWELKRSRTGRPELGPRP
jgi:hypothetical protein